MSSTTPPLSTPVSSQITNTTRHLYLNSTQNVFRMSEFHVFWDLVPALDDPTKQYKIAIRNLNLFHLFPSVPSLVSLSYRTSSLEYKTIDIPSGNWDAYSLANYLSYALDGVKVTYDEGSLHFLFSPEIYITGASKSAFPYLGIPSWYSSSYYGSLTESINPINLSTLQRIHVESNLTVNNIPISGRLAVVPVDQWYGEMIKYFDADNLNTVLCMDHYIGRLEIWLTDENGIPLDFYLPSTSTALGLPYSYPEWQMCLSITPVDNPGFDTLSLSK